MWKGWRASRNGVAARRANDVQGSSSWSNSTSLFQRGLVAQRRGVPSQRQSGSPQGVSADKTPLCRTGCAGLTAPTPRSPALVIITLSVALTKAPPAKFSFIVGHPNRVTRSGLISCPAMVRTRLSIVALSSLTTFRPPCEIKSRPKPAPRVASLAGAGSIETKPPDRFHHSNRRWGVEDCSLDRMGRVVCCSPPTLHRDRTCALPSAPTVDTTRFAQTVLQLSTRRA